MLAYSREDPVDAPNTHDDRGVVDGIFVELGLVVNGMAPNVARRPR